MNTAVIIMSFVIPAIIGVVVGMIVSRRPQSGISTKEREDIKAIGYAAGHQAGRSEGWQDGVLKGMGDGEANGRKFGFEEGYTKGRQEGYSKGLEVGNEEGREFMRNRYLAFMDETRTMVANDEMEIIQAVGLEEDL